MRGDSRLILHVKEVVRNEKENQDRVRSNQRLAQYRSGGGGVGKRELRAF